MTKITPRTILIANGVGAFIKTFMSATDLVKPGHVVSGTGVGQGACDWPDGADDVPIGVVGCSPDHDVETAYPVGASFPVYLCSMGAQVWVRFKTSGGALAAGSLVSHTDLEANGLTELGLEGTYQVIGRSLDLHDDIASESWVAVRLST